METMEEILPAGEKTERNLINYMAVGLLAVIIAAVVALAVRAWMAAQEDDAPLTPGGS